MKKRILPIFIALMLVLSGCGASSAPQDTAKPEKSGFSIACTTYPVYLLANTITKDMDDVSVELVIDQQISCLHNYTLTTSDMKKIEQADVLVINGAGLEDFLSDVMTGRTVIDCSEEMELRPTAAEHDHENEDETLEHGEYDPHIWMSPERYAQMARNLAAGLAKADPDHGDRYTEAGDTCAQELEAFCSDLRSGTIGQGVSGISIVTFHDGFSYLAEAFDFTIDLSIEEEEGAEASAQELKSAIDIVSGDQLPAVFVEQFGSSRAAETVAGECNVPVCTLSMCMSGPADGTIADYEQVITDNLTTIQEAYQ